MTTHRTARLLALALGGATLLGCASETPGPGTSATARTRLTHSVDPADVRSAPAPANARAGRAWSFPDDRAAWSLLGLEHTPWLSQVATDAIPDALRLTISKPPVQRTLVLIGGLYLELGEGLELQDWEGVRVRARTEDRFAGLTVAYNVDREGAVPNSFVFLATPERAPPLFSDGTIQTYWLPIHPHEGDGVGTPLESLAVVAGAVVQSSLDILSVELVPRGASYLDDFGVRHVARGGESRSTLYVHTPATVRHEIRVGRGTRFDFGLTVESGDRVRYRVTARPPGDESVELFDESVSSTERWEQHSIDLSSLAGRSVTLELEATSERPGAVGFWGAAMMAAAGTSERPNVIFYVIDGAGSDLMSLYGYARPTTPFLETLAAEAVVFERAYSNSTWTQPSTVSFMTSLHHSVLGGLRRGIHSTPVPAAATTMAEHFARAGYLTASLTSNPNAGRLIGLERGVDVLRDAETEHHSTSSVELHERFWELLERYPGGPWWVHFQTTDVHEPNQPRPPFAGTLVSGDEERRLREWDQQLFQVAGAEFGRSSIDGFYRSALARAGIDRHAYFDTRRGLYDETMMHQDHQLAKLVEDLKARGLWQDTLLVIGSDHGHPAGSFARWGRGLIEPPPEPWQGALFDAYATRVPLLFLWPRQIEGGRRVDRPVSMIDVLPTLLELLEMPRPEVIQGQSLAPLLRGERQRLRPVVLDEFRMDDETGEMVGNLELIDGNWGASLEIGPRGTGGKGRHAVPAGGRWGAFHEHYPEVPSLLLYDLDADPFATRAVNDAHPDLVEKYRELLLERWRAHQALSPRFQEAGEIELTPEQLDQLRTLGYIQ